MKRYFLNPPPIVVQMWQADCEVRTRQGYVFGPEWLAKVGVPATWPDEWPQEWLCDEQQKQKAEPAPKQLDCTDCCETDQNGCCGCEGMKPRSLTVTALNMEITLSEQDGKPHLSIKDLGFKHRGCGEIFKASNGVEIGSTHRPELYGNTIWLFGSNKAFDGKFIADGSVDFDTYAQALTEFEAWANNWQPDWDTVPKYTPCQVRDSETGEWDDAEFLVAHENDKEFPFIVWGPDVVCWRQCRLLMDPLEAKAAGIKGKGE